MSSAEREMHFLYDVEDVESVQSVSAATSYQRIRPYGNSHRQDLLTIWSDRDSVSGKTLCYRALQMLPCCCTNLREG